MRMILNAPLMVGRCVRRMVGGLMLGFIWLGLIACGGVLFIGLSAPELFRQFRQSISA